MSKNKKPKVGEGCTVYSYSDRHAGTVSRVSASGKTCWIKRDKAVRSDKNGMSENQKYTYEEQPSAKETRVSLRKTGKWVDAFGKEVLFGFRDAYHDFSF